MTFTPSGVSNPSTGSRSCKPSCGSTRHTKCTEPAGPSLAQPRLRLSGVMPSLRTWHMAINRNAVAPPCTRPSSRTTPKLRHPGRRGQVSGRRGRLRCLRPGHVYTRWLRPRQGVLPEWLWREVRLRRNAPFLQGMVSTVSWWRCLRIGDIAPPLNRYRRRRPALLQRRRHRVGTYRRGEANPGDVAGRSLDPLTAGAERGKSTSHTRMLGPACEPGSVPKRQRWADCCLCADNP